MHDPEQPHASPAVPPGTGDDRQPPIHVHVVNDDGYPADAALLVRAAEATLREHDLDAGVPAALSIVIGDDAHIARLNLQFRGVDAPTDVLSFPADASAVPADDDAEYWGDIVIAFPYAAAQAAREGHALMDSLQLLVVHGTLHLLGYDHDTPEARAEMWAVQADILRMLAISPAIVPALEGKADDEAG
jgi:probable rRNA maturation factor